MILIAHRANLEGPLKDQENSPKRVDECIGKGFDVEVDVRSRDGLLFLGHDEPQYEVGIEWLLRRKGSLWVHCKDVRSLDLLLGSDLNYFWHENDEHTITSKGFVWSYPGVELCSKSVAVLPERWAGGGTPEGCFGVCSDFVLKYAGPARHG